MDNIKVILIVAVVVFLASFYVYRQRNKGIKCIGCPDSKNCNGNCSSCMSER